MAAYRYTWTRKFSVPAQTFGEWFFGLQERSPEALIEAARDPQCIAHKLLEWDDSTAARAHRLTQARTIVNSLTVEVVNKKQKIEHVRAFIAASDRVGYVPTLEATNDELDAEEQRAIAEMHRMKQRWKSIQLARGVIQAIDEATQLANRKKRSK